MTENSKVRGATCFACRDGAALDFDFTMAFQPIVRLSSREIYAHEALARGLEGQGAGYVFEHVNDTNRYAFDQTCRSKALRLAAKLGVDAFVSINFLPNAVYRPELCIRTTLEVAAEVGFPVERIIFEITESENVEDKPHLKSIVEYYRETGFKTAIDDFGAGHSGLNFLAELQTDLLKLDMALIRAIDQDRGRRAIVRGIVQFCDELDITVIAEGVETRDELSALRDLGIDLFQGYHFAQPQFEALATVPAAAFELD